MFNLTENQQKKLDEWFATKDLDTYEGAIGGRFIYSFSPNSLGVGVTVFDILTKELINLTEYNLW